VAKTVGDVMTSLPTALDARASVPDAARAMRDGDIGDVLVTQDGSWSVLHHFMNSFRVSAGRREPPLTADCAQQLLGGIGPPDRSRPSVALGEEAQDALADVVGTLEVVGRERLPLQLAEHDLDLVQPGRVDRQPMEMDGKRQARRRPRWPDSSRTSKRGVSRRAPRSCSR
jgi:hypothetical protein